jgi:hypothetical protein
VKEAGSKVVFEKTTLDKIPIEIQKFVKKELKGEGEVFEVTVCRIGDRLSSYTILAASDVELYEIFYHLGKNPNLCKPYVDRVSISAVISAIKNIPHIAERLKREVEF